MSKIASYLSKAFSFFSLSYEKYDLASWLGSPFLPALHFIIIILLMVVVARLLHKARQEKSASAVLPAPNLDLCVTKTEHLVWANKILNWLCCSSTTAIPLAVEAWIQDLNMHISSQKMSFNALIYGLREGSSLPSLMEVRSVEAVGSNINAKVLLRTSEFGFMVSVEEAKQSNGKCPLQFSAIVTYFECWFSLVLTRIGGSVGFVLEPIEQKPTFEIKMKPLSKENHDSSLKPEVIALAIQEAVLNTTVFTNFTIINPSSSPDQEEAPSDSEKSCHGNTEDEITDVRGKRKEYEVTRNSVLRHRQQANNNNSMSAPGSPRRATLNALTTPGDHPSQLSGSLGSLSSITRTPSGRGPAKPIRIREKTLLITDIKFTPDNPNESYYPLTCTIGLDHPHQKKSMHLRSDILKEKLKFDLSSRSSKLKVVLQTYPDSKEHLLLKGSFSIEGSDMEQKSSIDIPMKGDDNRGQLTLQIHVVSGQDKRRSRKKSKSSPAVSSLGDKKPSNDLTPTLHRKESRTSIDEDAETKITVTRVTKSPTGSPARQVAEPVDEENGITFNATSVAETALKDLSARTSPVHKAKISITAVEKSPHNTSSMEHLPGNDLDQPNDDSSFHHVVSSPAINIEPPSSCESSPTKPSTSSDAPSKPVKVRRTRSLMGMSKKSKEKRLSAIVVDASASSHGSTTSLSRKSRFSKLFGKKKDKSTVASLPEGDESLATDHERSPLSNESPRKAKRSRSFKDLMKGKKKSSAL